MATAKKQLIAEREMLMETSGSVDAFRDLLLDKLELSTDSELDQQFARTTEIEIAAWLIRTKIYQIKIQRNILARVVKTRSTNTTKIIN